MPPTITDSLLGPTTGQLKLEINRGDGNIESIGVTDAKCSVGSDEKCGIRILGEGIRPVHCVILRSHDRTIVRRWAGNTWLNGRPFDDMTLRCGDELRLANVRIRVISDDRVPAVGLGEKPVGTRLRKALSTRTDWTSEPRQAPSERSANSRDLPVTELLQRLATAESRVQELQRQNDVIREESDRHDSQLANRLAALETMLASGTAQPPNASEDLILDSQVGEEDRHTWQQEMSEIHLSLAESQRRIDELESERREQEQALERLVVEAKEASQAREAAEQAYTAALAELEERRASDDKAVDMDEREALWNAKFDELEAEREAEEAVNKQYQDDLQETVNDLKKSLEDCEQEATGFREQLSTQTYELETIRQQLAEKDNEIDSLQAAAVDVDTEKLAELETRLATEVQAWEAEKAEMTERLAASEKDHNEGVEQQQALSKELEELNAFVEATKKERDEAITQRDEAVADRNKIRVERDETTEARDALLVERDQIVAERDELTVDRDRLRTEHEALMTQQDELSVQRAELVKERDQFISAHDDLTRERDELTKERDELTQQIAAAKQADEDETAATIAEIETKRCQLARERDELTQIKQQLDFEREQLENERQVEHFEEIADEDSSDVGYEASEAAQRPAESIVNEAPTPALDESGLDESALDEPALDESGLDESVLDEPALDEPALDESGLDGPALVEPALDELALDDSVLDEPVLDESALDESALDEPVLDEPAFEESAFVEPSLNDLVSDNSALDERALDEATLHEPAIDEPNMDESMDGNFEGLSGNEVRADDGDAENRDGLEVDTDEPETHTNAEHPTPISIDEVVEESDSDWAAVENDSVDDEGLHDEEEHLANVFSQDDENLTEDFLKRIGEKPDFGLGAVIGHAKPRDESPIWSSLFDDEESEGPGANDDLGHAEAINDDDGNSWLTNSSRDSEETGDPEKTNNTRDFLSQLGEKPDFGLSTDDPAAVSEPVEPVEENSLFGDEESPTTEDKNNTQDFLSQLGEKPDFGLSTDDPAAVSEPVEPVEENTLFGDEESPITEDKNNTQDFLSQLGEKPDFGLSTGDPEVVSEPAELAEEDSLFGGEESPTTENKNNTNDFLSQLGEKPDFGLSVDDPSVASEPSESWEENSLFGDEQPGSSEDNNNTHDFLNQLGEKPDFGLSADGPSVSERAESWEEISVDGEASAEADDSSSRSERALFDDDDDDTTGGNSRNTNDFLSQLGVKPDFGSAHNEAPLEDDIDAEPSGHNGTHDFLSKLGAKPDFKVDAEPQGEVDEWGLPINEPDVAADDRSATNSPFDESAPTNENYVSTPEEAITPEDGKDEDSIEDYMDRLLARAGADDLPTISSSQQPVAAVAPNSSTIEEGTQRVFSPSEFVPRSKAPEQNLAAMRELANASTRSAIDRAQRTRLGMAIVTNFGISLIPVLLGLILVVVGQQGYYTLMAFGLFAFLVGAYMFYKSVMALRQKKSFGETPNS